MPTLQKRMGAESRVYVGLVANPTNDSGTNFAKIVNENEWSISLDFGDVEITTKEEGRVSEKGAGVVTELSFTVDCRYADPGLVALVESQGNDIAVQIREKLSSNTDGVYLEGDFRLTSLEETAGPEGVRQITGTLKNASVVTLNFETPRALVVS